jgi:hypothetical protein
MLRHPSLNRTVTVSGLVTRALLGRKYRATRRSQTAPLGVGEPGQAASSPKIRSRAGIARTMRISLASSHRTVWWLLWQDGNRFAGQIQ